jgi:hypothetical protein
VLDRALGVRPFSRRPGVLAPVDEAAEDGRERGLRVAPGVIPGVGMEKVAQLPTVLADSAEGVESDHDEASNRLAVGWEVANVEL